MKHIIMTLVLAIGLLTPLALTSSPVFAANVFNNCGEGRVAGSDTPTVCKDANTQAANNGNNNPIINIIKGAITVLSYLIGIAAIIGIVVSGIRLTTAGGDSNAVASARSGLVYSLVGVAVAVLAQVIVAYVLGKV
jgi:hypothetical protein